MLQKLTLGTLILSVFLTGCAVPLQKYKEYTDTTTTEAKIKLILVDDPHTVCKSLVRPSPGIMSTKFLGCAGIYKFTGDCHVIVKKTNLVDNNINNIILGHELLHCLGATHE